MRLLGFLRGLILIVKSVRRVKNTLRISEVEKDGIVYRGFHSKDMSAVRLLIKQINNGVGFDSRRLLYQLVGSKLIIVAVSLDQGQSKVVGIDLFYFNPRDFKDGTVHEGFVGVDPDYQGRGIASEMRKRAISHFSQADIKGISTRISLNNNPSLTSALKLGFQPVETYKDQVTGEDRHYLIKWLA